jgi:hypothetical protein
MSTLKLSAGEDTDDLATFILGQLDDEALKEIEVEREQAYPHGLASEPITITLILTLGPPAIVAIGRLAERWLEARRQTRQMQLVLEAYEASPQAGEALTALAERNAEIALTLAEEPMPDAGAGAG